MRRIDLALFQKQAAKRLGVSQQGYIGWELDRKKPEAQHVPAIIELLGYARRRRATQSGLAFGALAILGARSNAGRRWGCGSTRESISGTSGINGCQRGSAPQHPGLAQVSRPGPHETGLHDHPQEPIIRVNETRLERLPVVTASTLPVISAPRICWVCGGPANSREHKSKRSDLKASFGLVTQRQPLHLHNAQRRNRRVGSLNSNILKSNAPFCQACNTTLTQPYDRAWEVVSDGLRNHPNLCVGGAVRINGIVPYDTRRCLTDAQLYFVKLFGCHVAENDISIDLQSLADALKRRRAHPHVYLRFGVGPTLDGQLVSGMSDIHVATLLEGTCAFATWMYNVAGLSVNVMYAIPGEKRQGLIGAWHPMNGTTKVQIHDLA